MSLTVRPLPGGLGAEVLALTASAPLDPGARRALREALFTHLILVLRAQTLTIPQQVALTGIFGDVEPAPDVKNAHPDDPRVLTVSNAHPGRVPRLSSSRYWHTDRSFVDRPSLTTLLYILQVPSSGGDTLFADMRTAYETLPTETKARIEGLSARHSYRASLSWLDRQHPWAIVRARGVARALLDRVASRTRRPAAGSARARTHRFPDVVHPLVRAHPVTGRKALYLNQVCIRRIEGLDDKASQAILDDLYAHALQHRFIYRHRWQPGDLVVWDNPSLMHRATATPPECLRVLHRTTAAVSE
jgi:taurine dioxygenase